MSSSGDQGPLFTLALSQQGALPMMDRFANQRETDKALTINGGFGVCSPILKSMEA